MTRSSRNKTEQRRATRATGAAATTNREIDSDTIDLEFAVIPWIAARPSLYSTASKMHSLVGLGK